MFKKEKFQWIFWHAGKGEIKSKSLFGLNRDEEPSNGIIFLPPSLKDTKKLFLLKKQLQIEE